MKDVLLTGAHGRVGTAITEHIGDDYRFTLLDRGSDNRDFVDADVRDLSAVTDAIDGHDALVHLAGDPRTDAPWDSVLKNNIIGTYNCLEAARNSSVETIVFASSIHVVGMYEIDHAPRRVQAGLLLENQTYSSCPSGFILRNVEGFR